MIDFGFLHVGEDRDLLWFAILDVSGLLALLSNPITCVKEIGKLCRPPLKLSLGKNGYVLTFHGRPAAEAENKSCCTDFSGKMLREGEYKVTGVSGTGFLTVEGLLGNRTDIGTQLSTDSRFEGVMSQPRDGVSEGALHAALTEGRAFIGNVMFTAITQRDVFLKWANDGNPTVRQVTTHRKLAPQEPVRIELAEDFFLVLTAPNSSAVARCVGAPGTSSEPGVFKIAGVIQKMSNPMPPPPKKRKTTKKKPIK